MLYSAMEVVYTLSCIWVETILAQTIMLNSFFGWYIRWLRGTLHGDTCNSLLALLVLYIPSGISKQVWFICYKSAMEVVYTLACIGSNQFLMSFRRAPGTL